MTSAPAPPTTQPDTPVRQPLLSVRDLVTHYPLRAKGIVRRSAGEVHAVCGVSLDLSPGETLGLVGESGCGKSTLGRSILNLQRPTSGEVRFGGTDLRTAGAGDMRRMRQRMQVVFQNPYAALDPRMTVSSVIAEPLRIHDRYADEGQERVRELLRTVELNPEHGNRYPHEFSGGQRQRVGIARALALRPELLVLDEPVSALDVSIQAGVVNLLEDLQQQLGLAYLFIAHDLSVVRHISHRIAVMYLGRVVEIGTGDELFDRPAHPYTQALISAIPLLDPRRERARARQRVVLRGEMPNPVQPPSGCRFRTRCPKFEMLSGAERALCVDQEPTLVDRGHGHPAACHYAEAVPVL